MSILKKIFLALLSIICVAIIMVFSFATYHHIKSNIEMTHYKKILGDNLKAVDIDNKKISCYEIGTGKNTIVLLSARGTPSPIADFMPLTKELSKNYKVVVIEYFGYGFSDDTNKTRSNENIVNEIRMTLKKLKIDPPYILMPHSISGVYSMYYANKYPEEVSAMICLDESKPNQFKDENPDFSIRKTLSYLFEKTGNFLGFYRLKNYFQKNFVRELLEFTFRDNDTSFYDKDLLDLISKDVIWHICSIAKVNAREMTYKNVKELFDMKYNKDLRVLSILGSEMLKLKEVNWLKLHQDVISNPEIQKIKIVKGWHYIHHSQFKTIADLTKKFLADTNID